MATPSQSNAKPSASDETDDQREKFKAALEAKKSKAGSGTHAHEPGGGGPVKDHSSRSGGKREFRRKSGG